MTTGPVGYAGAVAQVSEIQAQIAAMRSAFTGSTSASGGASVTGTSASSASGAAGASADSTFATQLQSALAGSNADSADTASADPSLTGSALTASSLLTSGLSSSAYTGIAGTATGLTGGAGLTGATTAALPTNASKMLTSDQQRFASRLASDTGLDPGVVSAWLLAEESGSAATARQSQNNNDWLNIGYTGAGTYGSSDSVWSNPTTAADATAGWLKGQNTIAGYGTASSGIQSILDTAGQAPADQVAALQSSGWSDSGYPDLDSLYSEVTG